MLRHHHLHWFSGVLSGEGESIALRNLKICALKKHYIYIYIYITHSFSFVIYLVHLLLLELHKVKLKEDKIGRQKNQQAS